MLAASERRVARSNACPGTTCRRKLCHPVAWMSIVTRCSRKGWVWDWVWVWWGWGGHGLSVPVGQEQKLQLAQRLVPLHKLGKVKHGRVGLKDLGGCASVIVPHADSSSSSSGGGGGRTFCMDMAARRRCTASLPPLASESWRAAARTHTSAPHHVHASLQPPPHAYPMPLAAEGLDPALAPLARHVQLVDVALQV
jgi:hypothetical protein